MSLFIAFHMLKRIHNRIHNVNAKKVLMPWATIARAALSEFQRCLITLRPYKLPDADDQVTKFLDVETSTTKDEVLDYVTNETMPLPCHMSICVNDLTLRPYKLSDADDFLEYASDEQVTKFLDIEPLTTKDEALDDITNEIMPLSWHMAICINDRSIGDIAIFNHEEDKAEIGYWLARKYWGQGIMTRALKMSVNMVLKDFPEIVRLEAFAHVENIASQRVLEKAGFKKEGLLRNNLFIKGSFVDEFIYSFLSTDVVHN